MALPNPSLPDARNAYFALAGLHAAPDRDPATAGQALWKLLLARAHAATSQRFVPDHDTPPIDTAPALGEALPEVSAPPLICTSHMDECVAQWIDAAEALRRQRDTHALIGTRCERLLDGDFAFEEALPPMRTMAEPIAQHGVGASRCIRWFTSGAVLAWVRQDRDSVSAMLNRADRLSRALLEGSHSLIGHMLAARFARDTLATAAALGVRDPSLSAVLQPLLAPLPDSVKSIKGWMVVESAYLRASIETLEQQPTHLSTFADFDFVAWLTRNHIGWHPQRTLQRSDAQWLRSMQRLDAGLHAAIDAFTREAAEDTLDEAWRSLTWVNPVGNMLIDIGRPAYTVYFARHADIELHREVAALAVNATAHRVPAAERRAWTAAQPLSTAARERISWSDDGLSLSARTWQETSAPDRRVPPHDVIRVAWAERR